MIIIIIIIIIVIIMIIIIMIIIIIIIIIMCVLAEAYILAGWLDVGNIRGIPCSLPKLSFVKLILLKLYNHLLVFT